MIKQQHQNCQPEEVGPAAAAATGGELEREGTSVSADPFDPVMRPKSEAARLG
jgi:hypothetical protein